MTVAATSSNGTTDRDAYAPNPELLTLTDIPGKGKGLVAKVDLEPGTLIISEPPLFTTASLTNGDTIEKDLAAIVRALPKPGQRAFLSLHNNHPGPNPFSNIVRSNGYPLGPNSDVGGIFPVISRINHSCRPNAQHAWNASRETEVVHAIRHISAGEELTLSYSYGGPSSERRKNLKDFFGFGCSCEVCSQTPAALAQSDERLRHAARLDAKIGDAKRVRQEPRAALRDCRALADIYAAEQIVDLRLARLFWDAFQICALHSDAARAKVFVQRYHRAKTLCEGADHGEADLLEKLMVRPESYENFGATKSWLSKVGEVPENKDSDSFERWLWRDEAK